MCQWHEIHHRRQLYWRYCNEGAWHARYPPSAVVAAGVYAATHAHPIRRGSPRTPDLTDRPVNATTHERMINVTVLERVLFDAVQELETPLRTYLQIWGSSARSQFASHFKEQYGNFDISCSFGLFWTLFHAALPLFPSAPNRAAWHGPR